MAEATLVIGIFNLPLALLEFYKPDAWESGLGAAIKSKHLKWAGIFLIALTFFISQELTMVRWRTAVSLLLGLIFVSGLYIGLAPQSFARITNRYYLSQSSPRKRAITTLDGAFRLVVSAVFIISAV